MKDEIDIKELIPIIIPSYKPGDNFVSFISSLRDVSSLIIIVDDGSGKDYRELFDKVSSFDGVRVIRHATNLGKGRALKDAFNLVLDAYPEAIGVVTADSDGQHLVDDIFKVVQSLDANPKDLILGCRDFKSKDVPWKSRFGNTLTCRVLKYLCGIGVSDTQTGLRGIPFDFLKILMNTPGERYEYETNMLLECNNSIEIKEIPITTVYDSRDNHRTHFEPLRDSITIYKVILAYSFSSVLATIVDFTIFSIMSNLGYGIGLSTAIARMLASFSNFLLNKNIVFKNKGDAGKQLVKYAFLVVVSGTISAYSIGLIKKVFSADVIIIKAVVETALFFFNYYVQRSYIFVKRKGNDIEKSLFSDEIIENTDWTKYYQEKKSWVSSFTQKYTLDRIIYGIEKYTDINNSLNVCELGGGNSCFCVNVCDKERINQYDIVDSNELAVKLFSELEMKAGSHKGTCMNLLFPGEAIESYYDFVYSVGLIEHFRKDDVKTMIRRHFEYCKDGGVVFITFPTPTKKYLFIRRFMELIGAWQFHDEKPIRFEEVESIFEEYGVIQEHFINWKLPLTQEVVIAKKEDK